MKLLRGENILANAIKNDTRFFSHLLNTEYGIGDTSSPSISEDGETFSGSFLTPPLT